MQEDGSIGNVGQFRFTMKLIEGLPPHDRDSVSGMGEFSDSEVVGLKLMVGKTGRKYFWCRFRFRGKKRMLKLGEWPSVNVADARRMVNEIKHVLASGKDPSYERNKPQSIPTLAEFAEKDYIPYVKLCKRSWKDDVSKLRREIGATLGNLQLQDITTHDVMLLHASIRKRASAATANRYLSLLSSFFSHAIQCGHLERNPAKGVKKFQEASPRHRFLSGEELSRFLLALDIEAGKTSANALKLLLLTGLRKMELLSLS
jgi:integrase